MLLKNMHGEPRCYGRAAGIILLLACCNAWAQNNNGSAVDHVSGSLARHVLDLSSAWRLALDHDHVYRAAISEQAAAQTERAQGRAGLLPSINAGYQRNRVSGTVTQPNFVGQRVRSDLDYDSYNAYVQLQQPLLNYERYAQYRRGQARAEQGTAVYMVKYQETGIRLATAYFNTLLAYDNLALQRALTASLRNQVAAVEARYRREEASRTDVQETQARLALARAEVIGAVDQWLVAVRELESVVGSEPTHITVLRNDFALPPLVPASLEAWLGLAQANSVDLQSAQMAVKVAHAEVDVAASRYLPTTDLVASYGRASSDSLSSLSQKTNSFTVGIQISIPLFAGGYNRANVARARSDRRRLQHQLRAALEKTLAEVTRQYTNVKAGGDHILALQAAVSSGELNLNAAHRGFAMGATSNLDVLNAQDRLIRTRYDLVRAHLEYLLARLKLAAAAGNLHSGRFDDISKTYLGPIVSLTDRSLLDGVLVTPTEQ